MTKLLSIYKYAGLTLGAALLVSGCEAVHPTVKVDFPEPRPLQLPSTQVEPAPPVTGSLYRKASYKPAFEDSRARAIGDTVTILIVENVAASQTSQSSTNQAASNNTNISALPFIPPELLAKFNTTSQSASDFSGKGSTTSANTFTGSITATVVDILPNGHLLVTGDKQIGVNQHVDVLRFSGTIDPRLVQPGSLINSTQVANVRVESKGRGAQAEVHESGWFIRFFSSLLHL